MVASMKQSPLEAAHLEAGARMAPFAGWNMPIQYDGILAEHSAVRDAVGVFDISHMGQVWIRGAQAASWLEGLLTNRVAALETDGAGQYTLMLNPEGGVIDDLIVYRESAESYFAVINAAKIDEDVAWMESRLVDGVELENVSDTLGAIAVQGPDSEKVFKQMTDGAELPPRFHMSKLNGANGEGIICRTGYTGEDGFELFCPIEATPTWWGRAVTAGAKPCGLGARDLLRLEKCYPLNGSDLNPERTPLEAGLGFFVDLDKGDFVGRAALAAQKAEGRPFRLVAIQVPKGPPPRPGYGVYVDGAEVGKLTSGGLSPGLKCGIALAYLPAGHSKVGTAVEIDVRGKRYAGAIVKKPFL